MGRAAIFIHGMFSRPDVWHRWVAAFESAGYACNAVALPGHAAGDSDDALRGLGIADYAQAVTQTAARSEGPVLVGHSMGGLIAQMVATRVPVAAAVLVNGAAPAPVFPLRPVMLPGLLRHFSTWALWEKPFRLSEWEARYLLLDALTDGEREAVAAGLIAESGRVAYEIGFGSLNWTKSNRVERAQVRCPMLELAGVRDRIVPIGVSRAMAAYYGPAMTYREYPENAHWLLGEPHFEERIAEALSWLKPIAPP
jgi:pimeloyl-ACP methyl ester carboxylesterase